MEQIINDLKSALARMNEKEKLFVARSIEADNLIADAKKKVSVLEAREKAVALKEAIYAKYDDIVSLQAGIKADKVSLAKEKSALDEAKKALEAVKVTVDADRKKFDILVALYKQKVTDCDNMAKQLAEDKKNLEKKVVEELTKKLATK